MHSQSKKFKTSLYSIFIFALTIAGLSLNAPSAQAYFSTLDTGDTLGANKYDVSIEPQFILDRYDGVNLNGRFDVGINEESNMRAIIGFGKVDFQAGAMYKYIPFPDTPSQPAIGIEAGAIFAHVQNASEFDLRLHPLVSKKVKIEEYSFNFYGSIPFGVNFRDGSAYYPIQLAAGTEWKIPKHENFSVMSEIGLNINAAFGYISFAGVFYFDDASLKASSSKK